MFFSSYKKKKTNECFFIKKNVTFRVAKKVKEEFWRKEKGVAIV